MHGHLGSQTFSEREKKRGNAVGSAGDEILQGGREGVLRGCYREMEGESGAIQQTRNRPDHSDHETDGGKLSWRIPACPGPVC